MVEPFAVGNHDSQVEEFHVYVGMVISAVGSFAPPSYEGTLCWVFIINSLEFHIHLPLIWIPGDGWISWWISGYVSYAMRDGRPLLKVLGSWVL